MIERFITSVEAKREELEWGSIAWFSDPLTSNAKNLVVMEVTLSPKHGHNFHKHPNQEEVLYVIEGEIDEWVDRERRTLRSGDSVFIPSDMVHASFNIGDRNARLLAILGPCIGSKGYELVDVADQEPWRSLKRI